MCWAVSKFTLPRKVRRKVSEWLHLLSSSLKSFYHCSTRLPETHQRQQSLDSQIQRLPENFCQEVSSLSAQRFNLFSRGRLDVQDGEILLKSYLNLRFEVMHKLGSGGYGDVYAVRNSKEHVKCCACKLIKFGTDWTRNSYDFE